MSRHAARRADTALLNYLVLIGHVDVPPVLFEKVFVPVAVRDELEHRAAPEPVRRWIAGIPAWIEIIASDFDASDPELVRLDDGERAAITLAAKIGAELILMDDRDGVAVARRKGLAVAGTLGILELAARRTLIELDAAVARLRTTNFRCRPAVLDVLLARHAAERNGRP